jgi:hypothetical protein
VRDKACFFFFFFSTYFLLLWGLAGFMDVIDGRNLFDDFFGRWNSSSVFFVLAFLSAVSA